MLFIKNLSKKEDTIKIVTERNGDNTAVMLEFPETEVDILSSVLPNLNLSLRKSIENLGKVTNSTEKDESRVSANVFTDKVTEIAYFIKDQKVALEQNEDEGKLLPINIVPQPEINPEDKGQKRYPRDMIIFITDTSDNTRLLIDERNLTTRPIIGKVGDYTIICSLVKWPIWSNLKFPVYMCVEQDGTVISASKLSTRTEGKIFKNTLEDVEIQEAYDYLKQSEEIRAKKAEERKRANNNPPINTKDIADRMMGKPGKNYDGNNKKQFNKGSNPKFKNFQNNGSNNNKNFRKNGNR